MNIILAEVTPGGSPPAERSFDKPSILIGRDAAECDIVFDGSRFPMVSRKHAEIRWDNGRWSIIDHGSTYGVFLNGEKTSISALAAGSTIQIGTDGPKLVVVWFEATFDSSFGYDSHSGASVAMPSSTPEVPGRSQSPKDESFFSIPQVKMPAARLCFEGSDRSPFEIKVSEITIGRDPECSVTITDSAMVSRRHARIYFSSGEFFVEDNNSFNGTLVNGQRISTATIISGGDEIRLGIGGPVIRFETPGTAPAKQTHPPDAASALPDDPGQIGSKTMVVKLDRAEKYSTAKAVGRTEHLMSVRFGEKPRLDVGRGNENDIRLDGLQISNRHARLTPSGDGIVVEDLRSTNGVFVNGNRISRQLVQAGESIQIGSFLLQPGTAGEINVYDTRAKTRIDAINLSQKAGSTTIVYGVSLAIEPNEFVGLLGASGAGKSTLVEILNGMCSPDAGSVLINGTDLYSHLDSLKQSIGHVPQSEIIHNELTVFRALYYIAKLRLSSDVTSAEIKQIVGEVLDVTGLSERQSVPIKKLSGGQRKRVSIAVELITKPSVIYLDEPTSGLDPVAEERIMRLFRQIADSGRTVVMTTHAMENVRMFDKIALLMSGRLVFYGTPDDVLRYLKAESFKQVFDRLEEPTEAGIRQQGESSRQRLIELAAEDWRRKFLGSAEYKKYIGDPIRELGDRPGTGRAKKYRLGVVGSVRQWITLSWRYAEVLVKDKLTLLLLLIQAPVIALLAFFVMEADRPRDFVYFVISLVAVWFGTSLAAREIIRERPVYKRERMVNLAIFPYIASKLFVLGVIVILQCILLFVPLKIFDILGLMPMPGELGGVPQFWAMLLTAFVGVALGLFVSALVRTPEMAASLVPLILIPQILFSGLVGVPHGVNRVVSMTMPGAWSFDTMKRFSTLDTLEEEGANPRGKTKGLGLFKWIEAENEKTVEKAKQDFEDYKKLAPVQPQDQTDSGSTSSDMVDVTIRNVPHDLSGWVTFKHPWMNEVLNQLVLVIMFGLLSAATLIVMRLKD